MIVTWVVCVIGWFAVYAYPDSYESRAKVYVDTNSALRPLLEQMTVDTDVLSRVELVTTAMLGRPQLEKVARETDLHLRAATAEDMDDLVFGMRQRIEILNDSRQEPNLYEITYLDPDPDMAQNVVSTLLNIFVEDSLGENRTDTQQAQEFLRLQLQSLGEELSTAEQSLADFKREHVGRMPGESGDYFGRLQSEMEALEDTRSLLRIATRRQTALRQQLAGESPSIDPTNSPQSELDQRIADNESRLQELQLRFTDLHPDVIAVKETLQQLKDQKQAELDALMGAGGAGIASDNPVFQNIQIELTNVSVEIATLREQEATHNRKIDQLRELIDVLPQVEAELARLTRDYDVKQTQYQNLLQRLEVAELSESAEQSEDVKFRIIDPPLLPDTPAAPNRPLIIALVLLSGLAAGGAVAFLLNRMKPVFSSAKVLRDAIGLPVLGAVQIMRTKERRQWRKAQLVSFCGALGYFAGIVRRFSLVSRTGQRRDTGDGLKDTQANEQNSGSAKRIQSTKPVPNVKRSGRPKPIATIQTEALSESGKLVIAPERRVEVDRDLLRKAGLLAPEDQARYMADQYRLIKRPIVDLATGKAADMPEHANLVMVASALPGDGKTFNAINIALSIAVEKDTSVLLVDADVPKPHISNLFGIGDEIGLIDLLEDDSLTIPDAIFGTDVPGLSILPAGHSNEHATELLASRRMAAIAAQLSSGDPNRVVICDSPPLLATSESRVLASRMGTDCIDCVCG